MALILLQFLLRLRYSSCCENHSDYVTVFDYGFISILTVDSLQLCSGLVAVAAVAVALLKFGLMLRYSFGCGFFAVLTVALLHLWLCLGCCLVEVLATVSIHKRSPGFGGLDWVCV